MSNTGIKHDHGKPMLSLIAPELWEAMLDEAMLDEAPPTFPRSPLGDALLYCNRAAHAEKNIAAVLANLRCAVELIVGAVGVESCVIECARAMQFGCSKYGRNNWKGGMLALRLLDAVHRHLLAAVTGTDIDEESGAKHYGCALFGIQCILYYAAHDMDVWDGYPWAGEFLTGRAAPGEVA